MDDGGAYAAMPLSALRKVIAARMAEATRTIPHFRVVADVEADALLDLRKSLDERVEGLRPSINDLLIKASAAALMQVPALNIQFVDGEVRQYHNANISVVISVSGGLSTPIVRQAQTKTIWEIAREVNVLAARAARNALKMEEVFGGSFSISNLGMYGVDQFDAIINSPQCAILAVGSAKPRLIVSKQREPRLATMMRLTLSVDHRVIDGVTAAAFLSSLRECLEQPAQLLS
jgi:pyruvate dehydrogenase E2 component (dihydrolipoamide acetyltransferase)